MPELPDVEVYVAGLRGRVAGRELTRVRVLRPFVLRSVTPPLDAAHGATVEDVRRLGKRIVIALTGELFLVVHLMIAGRLRWRDRGTAIPRKLGLAAFDFAPGTLLLTEAGSIKRASLHLVAGEAGLRAHDRGGIDVLAADRDAFADALTRENHTVKRSLTDPRLFSGIGNAYSDEILWEAGFHPHRRGATLDDDGRRELYRAMRRVFERSQPILDARVAEGLKQRKEEWREHLQVHRRTGEACPRCEREIRGRVSGGRETNFCIACQPLDLERRPVGAARRKQA